MDWLFGLVVKPSIPQYFWECPSCQSRYYSEPVQVGLQKGRLVRVPSICPQCFKRCSCGQLKQGEEHCSVCGDARKRITLRRYALSPDDPDFGVTSTGSTTYPTSVQTVNSSASGATWATGYTRATPITMLTSGTVSKVGLNVSSAAGHILIAIYDDLAGAPHNRLAYGSSTSAVSGWNDQTLNVLVFLLIATQYWPAFQNDSASLASYRVSTSTNDFVSSSYGSLPNPFGTPSSNAFGAYMRVTYVQIEGYTKGTQVQYVGPNTGPNAVSDFYFYTHTGAAGDHYIQALFNERGSTRVQFATGHANGGSTIAITLDSNPIDGDALIATVGLLGESVSSISQTGATWTRVVQISPANGTHSEIWEALNVSGASKNITISMSGAGQAPAVVSEYPPITASDKTATSSGSGASPQTIASNTTAATTANDEVLVACLSAGSAAAPTFARTPSNSFGSVAVGAEISIVNEFCDRMVHTTGTYSTSDVATGSGTIDWSGCIATFKLAQVTPYQRLWYSTSTGSANTTWNHVTEASGARDNSWDGSLISTAYYWFIHQWDNVDPGPSYAAGAANSGIYKAQAYGTLDSTWSGGTLSAENWSGYLTYFEFTSAGSQII